LKNSTLMSLVIKLADLENNLPVDEPLKKQIYDVVYSNDLEDDEHVPPWLLDLFNAILSNKIVEETECPYDKTLYGDVINFLAELEDVVNCECIDEGEYILFNFHKIKLSLYINRMGPSYYKIYKKDT